MFYLGGLREERKGILLVSEGWLLFRPNRSLAEMGGTPQRPGVYVGPDGRHHDVRPRNVVGRGHEPLRPGPDGAGADRRRPPLPRHPAGGQPVERELLPDRAARPRGVRHRHRAEPAAAGRRRLRHAPPAPRGAQDGGARHRRHRRDGLERHQRGTPARRLRPVVLLPARVLLDEREGRRPLPHDQGAREAAGHRRARAQGLPGADRGRSGEARRPVGAGAARRARRRRRSAGPSRRSRASGRAPCSG